MSPAAARLLAIPFALLAFGLGALEHRWEGPMAALSGKPPWLIAVATMASFGLPFGTFVALTRRRPASLRCDPDRRRFTAPTSPPRTGAPFLIMMIWWSGRTLGDGINDIGGEFGDPGFYFWAAAIIAVLACVPLLLNRPMVSLTPGGLVVERLLRRPLLVEWDEVAPGQPLDPTRRSPRVVVVGLLARQTLGPLGGFGTSIELPTGMLHVEPRFLVAAIRHYAEDPTHRAAIGTEAEHERLRDALRRQAQPIS
jgi:hypothetical protein